ncbi:SLATT domain-containing protein [Methylobacillus sp.]|uniref:SLATT domain-containing protein n=1 Tax=Methylobacillus sp. TaxID=56818 RepID=UPI0012C0A45B|nr:SLATT domain-containing protein [Methylobacillus sp.]MPS47817.1 SLATT domain-containing protein [Methylobacillus sp.]
MKLIDRVRMIRNCRFHAARRLQYQHKAYMLTMTVTSLYLIILPLMELSKVHEVVLLNSQYDPSLAQFFQISLAIIVLVFSLQISSQNIQSRSEAFHRCGIELDAVLRQAEINDDPEVIDKKFGDILSRYENHSQCDFFLSMIACKKREYKLNRGCGAYWDFWVYRARVLPFWLFRLVLGYLLYAAILLLQVGIFISLFKF